MGIKGHNRLMDFLRPVETVIPGAQEKLLAVFVETTAALSIRTAARLSGVSPAQTSRILPELAVLGILERNEVPPSTGYRLVEDSVATRALRQLARSRDLVLDGLSVAARAMPILPISILVFGSMARGDATRTSDIDVVMVRPGRGAGMANWSVGVEEWCHAVGRLTGNGVDVMEVDEGDVRARLRSHSPVWPDIQHEGVAVFGRSLDELTTGRIGESGTSDEAGLDRPG
jgi:predicted nucleotidyltransferase